VDDFCARPARSAMYLSTLAQTVGSDTSVSELVPTQQIAASTTVSLAATVHDNATQLAGTPESAARTSLTAIYQQLEQGIADGQEEIAQLPTGNVTQFTGAFQKATADVLGPIATAKQAIAKDPTLGPLLAADPSCA
jgi:hypothetical protein